MCSISAFIQGHGLLKTAIAVIITATFVNQGKRAYEKYFDTLHALRTLSGIFRNISRHYIRTASRLNRPCGTEIKLINKKTFQKGIINLEYVGPLILSSCSTIGSATITYAVHRAMLNLRNLNTDFNQVIEIVGIDQKNFGSFKATNDNDDELDYLIRETLTVAYIFNIIADKLEFFNDRGNPFRRTMIRWGQPIMNIPFAFIMGVTASEMSLHKNFDVGTYNVKVSGLLKTCNLFMYEDPDNMLTHHRNFWSNLASEGDP